jgi:hypothetical protein
MSDNKQNKPLQPEDILAAANSTLPTSSDPEILAMQKGLLALQLKQLSKQVAEQDEAEQSHNAARLQNAIGQEKARQQQVQRQSMCPHVKPNGQSALGGQRINGTNYFFLCLYCQKEFNETNLPPHLRLPLERVGGPSY